MDAWRIARASHQALDGKGARLNGGRWNSEGLAVVYLACTLALAALEYLVHVDIEDVPDDLVAIRVHIPDDVLPEEVDVADLDEGWNATPDAPGCIRLGDEWARRGDSLLLKVPSAVVPEESNYLMNPGHADAGRVEIGSTRPFTFDQRLSG